MTGTFSNAAPMSNMLGVDDDSTRQLVLEREVLPQHLVKLYIYAKSGPTDPQLVIGNVRTRLYGADSFDMRKKWANHATLLSNDINAIPSAQMLQRLRPKDAGPNATLRLWMDVLPTQITDYERMADGSYKLTGQGNKIPLPTKIDGFRVKFVVTAVELDEDGVSTFGQATMEAGDQVDGENQSTRYPIEDYEASFFGSDGNNQGVRHWSATINSAAPVSQTLLQATRSYPYNFAFVSRKDEKSTAGVVSTLKADQAVALSLKPRAYDDVNSKAIYAGTQLIKQYQSLQSNPPRYAPFGKYKLYENYVKQLHDMFYAAELPVKGDFSDFTGEADETFKFNIFGGHSSLGVPYHSYEILSGVDGAVKLTSNASLFATGGSDGTMNDEKFAELVEEAIAGYADETNIVQNRAKYPEAYFYDTGLPMTTKKAICQFISLRKDTAVILGTAVAGEEPLTASEDSARAVLLKTYAQMYPESEFFGTKTMRAVIVSRSGLRIDDSTEQRLPLTFELAKMALTYMGSPTGSWTNGASLDDWPNNVTSLFYDISETFTPATVRSTDWANGMNWVESFDLSSYYFPAVRTVYDNDTSVLTGFLTMCACVELEKVSDRGRIRFSGNQSLTNDQFAQRMDGFIMDNVVGRFDGKYIIESNTYFTDADVARGYSYTNNIDIGAPSMKTVGTLSITAKRIADMQSTASA